MAPYLATVKSFEEVPGAGAGAQSVVAVTGAVGIDTVAFLQAADGLVGLFDLLASKALIPVQSDIRGNINKVRARYDEAPESSATLQLLIDNDTGKKKATEGLVWLMRGLSFTCKALQELQADPTLELSGAFNKAYEQTLKQYHGFIAKAAFTVALAAVPYRAVLYTKLAADPEGEPQPADKLNESLNNWLAALAQIIAIVHAHFVSKDKDYEKKYKA